MLKTIEQIKKLDARTKNPNNDHLIKKFSLAPPVVFFFNLKSVFSHRSLAIC